MPKHRNKQHWNDWNPGSQRNNRQNAYYSYQSFQRNRGQTFNNSYSNQGNYTQNYSNNYCDQSFQRNFPQNRSHSRFNQNYHTNFTQNTRNTDFMPNFQRNVPSHSINDLIVNSNVETVEQKDIDKQQHSNMRQNDSTKNIKENPSKSNPWYEIQPKTPKSVSCIFLGPKDGRKQKPKSHFLNRYYKMTENFTEKGYIIKETLYRDPSLFYANNNISVDSPSDSESNSNWTDTFWQKHDDTAAPTDSRMSQSTKTVSRQNQNRLERTLNDMLAKPAEMCKGKSLLLKMGWQGGGLGRDEDGIVEPIAPRATYAVKTIGLGHPTEKPKKPISFANLTNKKLKHPEFQNHFCTNVLLYILEFVKNDEEDKIVFEPRLRKLERKRIHQIVEKIRDSNNLDDFENFENFSDRHLELVKEIWVHNCYELWTESEEEKQNRRICLFKEAPAHVYLVTPDNLTENDEKNDDTDGKNDVNIKDEKDSENINGDKQNDSTKTLVSDTDKESDNQKNEENCKIYQDNEKLNSEDISQDIKKEISELTDSQMAVDNNMDENNQILANIDNNTLEITQKVEDSDFYCEIIPNTELSELIIISSDESDSESTEMATNNDLSHEMKPYNDKNVEIIEENQQILVQNGNKISENVADINICNDTKFELEINEKYSKIYDNLSENININGCIRPKIENDEQTFNDYLNSYKVLFNKTENPRDRKESILSKIVEYFKEFSSDETFKEFRFLGPFNGEQIMQINVFFKICMKQDNIENSYEKKELLAAFDNDLIKFDVLEDNNGKRFIQKVGDNLELPSEDEDEDVKYASSLYL